MNRNDVDLNLIIGLLSLGTSVISILLTLLIEAFGPLAALIVVAFIAGSLITGGDPDGVGLCRQPRHGSAALLG